MAQDGQHNNAVVTRTIKPYPAVPDDAVVDEALTEWHSLEDILIGAVWAFVLVVVALLMLSCLFIWGMLA